MTSNREPKLYWFLLPLIVVFAVDFWILTKVVRETVDAGLAGELFLHAVVHVSAVPALFVFWWGMASLLRNRLSHRPDGRVGRLVFGSVLSAAILLFDHALIRDRISPSSGISRGGVLSVLCILIAVYIMLPKLLTRWKSLQWAAPIATATVSGVTAVLFGVSMPPMFSKITYDLTTLLILSPFFCLWVFLATSTRPIPNRPAIAMIGGGLLVFVVSSTIGAQLSVRSSNVVVETLEVVRAFRRLERNVGNMTFLSALWNIGPHAELASRPIYRPSCPFVVGTEAVGVESCARPPVAPVCKISGDAQARSLLLLSLDSFRADYFGVPISALPNFNRLRQTSLVFDKAAQTCSGTGLSIFSMHTGRFPMRRSKVADAWPSLARSADGENLFYMQGWRNGRLVQDTADFTDHIIADLRRLGAQGKSFFIHAHYMSLHMQRMSIGRHNYERLMRSADTELGRILDLLDTLNLTQSTIVIVTGDHGEERRGDRGYVGHGYGVWETSVLTPLILRIPGEAPRREETAHVSGADIWPTALDALGATCDYEMHGVSLLKSNGGLRPIFSSSYAPNPTSKSLLFSNIHSVTMDGWKLIMDLREGTTALYNLMEDPGETRNLADKETERLALLSERLQKYLLDQ